MRADPGRRRGRTLATVLLTATLLGLTVAGGAGGATSSPSSVRSCRPFVISKTHDSLGFHRFRAWDVKRSSLISCAMTRRLIKAAYGTGPLHIIKRVLEPGGLGRPTYWVKGGWRCGNGAGGADCLNVERPELNVVENFGAQQAVTASTGL